MGDAATIFAEPVCSHIGGRSRTVLGMDDARAMLTRVEDSLETVADVLAEMRSLVSESTFRRSHASTPSSRRWRSVWRRSFSHRKGMWMDLRSGRRYCMWLRQLWRLPQRISEGGVNDGTDACERLRTLADEIDEIARDTKCAGTSLFDGHQTALTFRVRASQDDEIDVRFEPFSAETLGVSFGKVDTRENAALSARTERIDGALIAVRERIVALAEMRRRLGLDAEMKDSAPEDGSDHRSPAIKLGRSNVASEDADVVRKRLDAATRRIAEDADHAAVAQARDIALSAKQLAATLYEADDEPPARIYMLDRDDKCAPVAHLRRTMVAEPF